MINNQNRSEFDSIAHKYNQILNKALELTGESTTYYALNRINFLQKSLKSENCENLKILDFGCGDGKSSKLFEKYFKSLKYTGIEISENFVHLNKKKFTNTNYDFLHVDEYIPDSSFDLAFCNGVFHHIPKEERLSTVKYIFNSIKPGGFFAFWENNPYNPGTRYLMKKTPFDKNASMLSPKNTIKMLRNTGFEIISTRFLFFFPRFLSLFRVFEPYISMLPLGGQYQVLAKKNKI